MFFADLEFFAVLDAIVGLGVPGSALVGANVELTGELEGLVVGFIVGLSLGEVEGLEVGEALYKIQDRMWDVGWLNS